MGLCSLIGLNQLFSRIPALYESVRAYAVVQVVNLAAGTWVIVYGLPGYPDLRAVHWLLGLLLFWHVARNNFTYRDARRERRLRARAGAREAIVRALEAGREGAEE